MFCEEEKKCSNIARELRDIKRTMKQCCCILLKKEFTADCNCTCECTCSGGGGGQCLCIANSKCDSGEAGVATVTVPANSCITKIYASSVRSSGNGDSKAPEARHLEVKFGSTGSSPSFCHIILEDQGVKGGSFDTSFIQPLCVGTSRLPVTATAYKKANEPDTGYLVNLTVVYCPSCCEEEKK